MNLNIEMPDTISQNFMMLIPHELVGEGEPGEPLSSAVVKLIKTVADFGWAPIDFGEVHEMCCELWFYRANSINEARASAIYFILTGGDA